MKLECCWLRSPDQVSGASLESRLLSVRPPYSPVETVSGILEISDVQPLVLAVGLLWPVPIPFSYGWTFAMFAVSLER